MAEIIAIDGPSGAGKSTVAKLVADRLGFVYLNSGYMYRALALAAQQSGAESNDCVTWGQLAVSLQIEFSPDGKHLLLSGEDVTEQLRVPEISGIASQASACPEVRAEMVRRQRALSEKYPGVVMEGRDIGSHVFPQARYKVYLDAQAKARAQRRHSELSALGIDKGLNELAAEMRQRDQADMTRELAPLKRTADAYYLDSTDMNIEQVVSSIEAYVKRGGSK